MTYAESELLALSGVQHVVFCERQAALIHVEGLWQDNALTVDGGHRHRAVHESAPRRERRGDLIIVRGLTLCSLALGLVGIADVVEFHRAITASRPRRSGGSARRQSVPLPGASGVWTPFPVEYKRGRPKAHRADEVQLCAQAMCLEEMLGAEVCRGALFYGKEQRRVSVTFDDALRGLTKRAARRLHELLETGETPQAVKEKKCKTCSLLDLCVPEAMSRGRSAGRYVAAAVLNVLSTAESDS